MFFILPIISGNIQDIHISGLFTEKRFLLIFFGSLGGSVRAAVLKITPIESLRVIFIGASVSLGIGETSPHFLLPLLSSFGIEIDQKNVVTAIYGILPFITGLLAVNIVESILEGRFKIFNTDTIESTESYEPKQEDKYIPKKNIKDTVDTNKDLYPKIPSEFLD